MSRNTYVALFVIASAAVVLLIMDRAFASLFASLSIANQNVLGDKFNMSTAAGLLVAGGGAAFVWLRPKYKDFMGESVDELGKVSWPTNQETKMNTVVVIIFSFISAGILGVFDAVFGWLTNNNLFLF
jgi:preprotein translocase SecE subunit